MVELKRFLVKNGFERREPNNTHTHTYIYINTHRNCVILRRSHRIPAKRELKQKYIRETDKNPIEIYFVLKLHFRANFWYVCMFVLFQRSMLFVQTFTSHFWHVFFSTPLLFVFFCVLPSLCHIVWLRSRRQSCGEKRFLRNKIVSMCVSVVDIGFYLFTHSL